MPDVVLPNTLIDTSSWISFFSRRHAGQAALVENLIQEGLVAINGLILAELLQGFRKPEERKQIERRLMAIPFLALEKADCVEAGHLSAILRRKGGTTSLIDILIAQSAIRHGLSLLHYDGDFNRIAGVSTLKIHPDSLRS